MVVADPSLGNFALINAVQWLNRILKWIVFSCTLSPVVFVGSLRVVEAISENAV